MNERIDLGAIELQIKACYLLSGYRLNNFQFHTLKAIASFVRIIQLFNCLNILLMYS